MECRYCKTELIQHEAEREVRKTVKGRWGRTRDFIERQTLIRCPECGYTFWTAWDEWGKSVHRETVQECDILNIRNSTAYAYATRVELSYDEMMKIWHEVQNEPLNFLLLEEEWKREIVRLIQKYGEAHIATFEIRNLCRQFYIGKESDFGSKMVVSDPDWRQLFRKLEAARAYIKLVHRRIEDKIMMEIEGAL